MIALRARASLLSSTARGSAAVSASIRCLSSARVWRGSGHKEGELPPAFDTLDQLQRQSCESFADLNVFGRCTLIRCMLLQLCLTATAWRRHEKKKKKLGLCFCNRVMISFVLCLSPFGWCLLLRQNCHFNTLMVTMLVETFLYNRCPIALVVFLLLWPLPFVSLFGFPPFLRFKRIAHTNPASRSPLPPLFASSPRLPEERGRISLDYVPRPCSAGRPLRGPPPLDWGPCRRPHRPHLRQPVCRSTAFHLASCSASGS